MPATNSPMPSDDIAISVRNVTKNYRLFGHPGDRIKQFASLGLKQYHRDFTALQDVSFDLKKGEIVGIVGRNGSGKSTLLQVICGILKPTAGNVHVNGRISALLELGAGFNPEFTGRENVFFQGALMGLGRSHMAARFDEIAAFADIGDFIEQPVRTYSSGMFVRLAFAVAIHVDPDILVVDEALAVGDARFQAKCFRRIQALCERGGAILFVTHATDQVTRFCSRAMLIDQGTLVMDGMPRDVVNLHLATLFRPSGDRDTPTGENCMPSAFTSRPGYNPGEYRFGDGGAEILDFRLGPEAGDPQQVCMTGGQTVELGIRVAFRRRVERATFAVAVSSPDGKNLFGVNSRDLPDSPPTGPFLPGQEVEAIFTLNLNLARGEYLVSLSVSEDAGNQLEPMDRRYDSICLSIDNPVTQRGAVHMAPRFALTMEASR
jgi:lipopolysaccharide transport system ATP-binding protein